MPVRWAGGEKDDSPAVQQQHTQQGSLPPYLPCLFWTNGLYDIGSGWMARIASYILLRSNETTARRGGLLSIQPVGSVRTLVLISRASNRTPHILESCIGLYDHRHEGQR